LLFLVHCDRPFVGPVYEVILALVRNVRNGVKSRLSTAFVSSPLNDLKNNHRLAKNTYTARNSNPTIRHSSKCRHAIQRRQGSS